MGVRLGELLLLVAAVVALAFVFVCVVRARARTRVAEPSGDPGDEEDGNEGRSTLTDTLAARLSAFGVPLDPFGFLVFVVIVPVAVAVIAMRLFGGFVAPALVAVVMAYFIVFAIVREWRRGRAWRFEEKLVDAVDLMAGALKGGESPTQALTTTGDACGKPILTEFAEVVHRLEAGMTPSRALDRMLKRYDSESVRLFANTLAAKWSAGGDMAPILLAVSRMMRDRLRHRLRVRAQLAGAVVTAILVALSPYVLVLAFSWRFPEWLESLLLHPIGPGMLFLAVCLQIVGFVWLHRILRVEA